MNAWRPVRAARTRMEVLDPLEQSAKTHRFLLMLTPPRSGA